MRESQNKAAQSSREREALQRELGRIEKAAAAAYTQVDGGHYQAKKDAFTFDQGGRSSAKRTFSANDNAPSSTRPTEQPFAAPDAGKSIDYLASHLTGEIVENASQPLGAWQRVSIKEVKVENEDDVDPNLSKSEAQEENDDEEEPTVAHPGSFQFQERTVSLNDDNPSAGAPVFKKRRVVKQMRKTKE